MPKGMELTELDKKVLYYQDRGHLVPSRELIKTPYCTRSAWQEGG